MVQHLVFANNASSRLHLAIGAGDVVIPLQPGEGGQFPTPAVGESFMLTLEDRRSGQIEICECTARSGDSLTVLRGQEGSVAQAFASGATISNRLTAATLSLLMSAAGIPDAPTDSKIYGRKNAAWTESIAKTDFTPVVARVATLEGEMNAVEAVNVTQGTELVRLEDIKVDEAPSSATIYGRQGEAWVATVSATSQNARDTAQETATTTLAGRVTTNEADIALRAPILNPIFTGNPTAPTPATADSDTSIATTAFVKAQAYLTDAPSDGKQYARKNAAWAQVDTATFIGDTPPLGPLPGQLWWESDTGNLFIYYNDGNSSQWVPAAANVGPPGPGGGGSGGGGTVDWVDITGKPATFPPTLPITQSDVTSLVTDLAAKEPLIAGGTTAQYWRGDKSWQTLDKTAVGLSNVDNTADASKPVSSATQTALNLKADIASPTFTGDPKAPTPSTADNDTSIATTAFVKAQSYLVAADIAAKAPLASPLFTGDPQAPTPATADNDTSIATTAHVQANAALKANLVHTHAQADVTNLVADLAAKAPTVHTHAQADVTNLVTDLAGKAAAVHTHAQADVTNLVSDLALKATLASPTFTGNPLAPTPATADNDTSIATTAHVQANVALKAALVHTHAESDVTNLVSDLAGKAPTVHTHAESDVTNLVSDLALKAPLASPVFTGNPTAPTPSTADNDTSVATTAHVQANAALKANVTHTHAESDVTNLVTDLAAKAPLASPVFTGNPTAPTPTVGDNDTSLATTAFVTAAVAAGGGGGGGIAEAPNDGKLYARKSLTWDDLTDDFAAKAALVHTHAQADVTNLTSDLALKAALASPIFTGDPTAPTPAVADNDTSLATTAFVKSAIAAAGTGQIFYLDPTDAADVATYKRLLLTPSAAAESTLSAACTGTGDFLLASFITDLGVPGAVDYPAGSAYRRLYGSVSGGIARFHLQVYTRTSGGTETLVRDEFSNNFSDLTATLQEWLATPATGGTLATTDRLVTKIYAQRVSGPTTVTVTFYAEGSAHASQVQTTIPPSTSVPISVTPPLSMSGGNISINLTAYAPLASPVFTGDPQAPTPSTGDNDTSIATTAFVKAQGYLTAVPATYAPLASPVFTGDPTAPTPATGDNDTSIATTAFVKAQAYLTAVPATYALLASPIFTGNPTAPTPTAGDNDTSLATTAFVVTAIAGKADLASPALTGNPTAPTPSVGDSDTSVATTAFVATSFAPLASPTLTGDPKAPTPATADNDTSIATTAYVQAQLYKKITVSTTAPGSPVTGELWVDTT